MDFGLVYHLWSFGGEPGELLERAVGEVALDRLVVPVVTGAISQFRPDPATSPNLFQTEGGWHYPPSADVYRSGSIRPRTARWFGKRHTLERVAEFARRRDLKLVCRVDPRGVGSLIEHESRLRQRNAWGDEDVSTGACALNPDLRELLVGVARDLERFGPTGIQLVDWAPDVAAGGAAVRPLADSPSARALLDICFCPSCRQAALTAGVDPDHAARSVRLHVEALLGEDEDAETRLAEDELLDAYLAARRAECAAWLGQLAATHSEYSWSMLADDPPPTISRLASESASAHLDRDAFTTIYRTAEQTPACDGEDDEKQAPTPALWPGGRQMRVWTPSGGRADHLVRVVSDAARQCAGPIDFDGLEEAPPEVVDWLRQAVRFARRG